MTKQQIISAVLIGMMSLPLSVSAIGKNDWTNKIISTPTYKNEYGHHQLIVSFGYASDEVLNTDVDLSVLDEADIVSIDLVYSDFPPKQSLKTLTQSRIDRLSSLHPSVNANLDNLKIIKQTNCKNREEAQQLFHGAVIAYRPKPTKEMMEDEVKLLKDILSGTVKDGTPSAFLGSPESIETTSKVTKSHPKEMFESELAEDVGEEYYITLAFDGSGLLMVGSAGMGAGGMTTYNFSPDTTVSAVLNRNKWEDISVVADVTGSMAPYTGQFFTWLKLETHQHKVKQVTFFNDGDATPDAEKKIGATGGVYVLKSGNYEKVEDLAFKAMMAGGGGDLPENNLEATLKAIDNSPEVENIVMIADNYANVKDFKLIKSVKKPVKVILCGAGFGVNSQYLDLARETGGSVHLMEDDLTDLISMSEGDILEIRGQKFVIKEGKFEQIF